MTGAEVLPAILSHLHQRYPELAIELVLSNAVEDLLRRDADIAVRMVKPSQSALVARRLGEIKLGLHAHRRYLDRRGMPARLEQLSQHALIGVRSGDGGTQGIPRQRRGIPHHNNFF